MELLTVRNLSIEYRGRTLVAGVDLALRAGMRMGLIGRNGSGKSSLLEVLAGVRPASGGRVRRAPGVSTGYLPQLARLDGDQNVWEAALEGISLVTRLERELREQEERLGQGEGNIEEYGELREEFERTGGYAAEAVLREHLAALGLSDRHLETNVGQLSGGERARLALARVLAAEPQLLILDEPTNHLDLPALEWLGNRLRRWRGAVVLVSHDRELLDLVSSHTGELRNEQLEIARGGYSRLREQQGVISRASERRERERRKEVARLEGIARELHSWGNAQAQRRRRRAERAKEELGTSVRDAARTTLPRPASREAEGRLLEARHLTSVFDGRELFEDAHLTVDAGDKIALLGSNGSGKSTLLRLIAGESPSDDPRAEFLWHRNIKLLHSGQFDRGLHDDRPILKQLDELVSGERARMLLALSGLPQESWERLPGELSGGERARAGLARVLAAEANLLLLDEPSNDLDLKAIETLHQTLEASDAAVVFATHDRALARLATRVLSIEDGALVEYRGGYEGYLSGRRRLEPGLEPAPADDQVETPEAAAEEDDELERLELERLGIEARLDDPLTLTERELSRLEGRRREVLDLLSQAYDRRLPSPLPAFSVSHGSIRVTADLNDDGLSFGSDAPVVMSLVVRERVGHLTLRVVEGSALLPWARAVLLDAAVRLAFYALAPDAVQHHSHATFDSKLLEPAEGGWWTIDRHRFEALEGWNREPQPRVRRTSRRRRRRSSRSRSGAGPEAG